MRFRPRRAFLDFKHAIKPRNAVATGSPRAWAATKVPSCGPDPAIAARAANLRAVPPQKVGPVTVRGENPSYISESYKSYRVLVYFTSTQDNLKGFARSRNPSDGPGVCVLKPANIMMRETKYISPPRQKLASHRDRDSDPGRDGGPMVSLPNPVTVLSPDKFNLPSVPSRNLWVSQYRPGARWGLPVNSQWPSASRPPARGVQAA